MIFDTLYHYPRVVARPGEGLFAPERERFLTHCAETGSAPTTLLRLASELLLVAERIERSGVRSIPITEGSVAADRWVRYHHRQRQLCGSQVSHERFVPAAMAWLRFLGPLQPTYEKLWLYDGLIHEFSRTLRDSAVVWD